MGFRAVVLSAGRATRMRPLTEFAPKALLPVAGNTVLGHTLEQLAAAGCEAAAVNLHHLGEAIVEHFGGAHAGVPIRWSPEEELLGTLGALGPLGEFIAAAETLVVINGDSLCRWPLKRLLRRHRQRGARATLLFARGADPGAFGGGVGLDIEGRVVSFRGGGDESAVDRRRVFAGLHLLDPELVAGVEPEPADFVTALYEPMLERGERIEGVETGLPWHDLGTPERYLEAVLDWVRGRGPLRALRRGRILAGAEIERGAKVRDSVVEAGARVERGARVEHSVLLPGSVVAAGCSLRRTVVGYGAVLHEGTKVERRLITRERAGVQPRAGDSVVGGLILSPLERVREARPGRAR